MTIDVSQSELVKKSSSEQAGLLAGTVRGSSPNWKCSQAVASLEKSYPDGSGGWLVRCDEGQDYWSRIPDKPKATASTLPSILARQSGTDCYANLRTALPEHIKQCSGPPTPPDHVIRSCSAIIQSGRLDQRPDALAYALTACAIAYGGCGQLDLALADLDQAATLQPDNLDVLFSRAISLERKGELDQAIVAAARFSGRNQGQESQPDQIDVE